MTLAEIEAEVKLLKRALDERISEDIKYRRMIEDLTNNLTFENMPTVKKEVNGGIERVSQISADVDGISRNVSRISEKVDSQGAELALVVERENGDTSVNAASIISAINNSGSSIKMSADKISFEGSDIRIDTDKLSVNAEGRVEFSSPVVATDLYSTSGYFNGRVDLGSSGGLSGYAFLHANEFDGLELHGEGGIVLSTEADYGDPSGDVEIYADAVRLNGNRVLTDSDSDIAYLGMLLGIY